jgi:hypothetical protein
MRPLADQATLSLAELACAAIEDRAAAISARVCTAVTGARVQLVVENGGERLDPEERGSAVRGRAA